MPYILFSFYCSNQLWSNSVHFKKQLILLIMLTLSFGALANTENSTQPEVFVNGEVLIGEYSQSTPNISVFKGIPFALPPIHELRWQSPKAHQPRKGKQQAKEFAPGCFQDDYNTQWYRKVGKAFGAQASQFKDPLFSEDCLYLNIWQPSQLITPQAKTNQFNNKKLPVMVWIHGGSNKGGWSYENNYIGDKLAAKGDVIVVSIAYRLGVFGFFSHPYLSQSEAPANFGLLDQIAALKWIQANIGAFGGDSSNVTIFGESAGAANIGNLMLSPMAEGLFQRAISQSGGFQLWGNISLQEQQNFGAELTQAFAIEKNALNKLKKLSAEQIFTKVKQQFPQHYYGAVVDGKVLPLSSIKLLLERKQNVDLLMGSNQDEWLMYLDDSVEKLNKSISSHPEEIQTLLKNRAQQEKTVARGHDQMSAMIDMVCPAYIYAEQVKKSNKNVFLYRFKRVREGNGGEKLQAYHGAEIPYVFNRHDDWIATNKDDTKLTSAMMQYWTNFAKNGDPNNEKSGELPTWPQFNKKKPEVLALSKKITVLAAPDFSLCQKISPYLKIQNNNGE
jgi:para-nitrobenzyl esterase